MTSIDQFRLACSTLVLTGLVAILCLGCSGRYDVVEPSGGDDSAEATATESPESSLMEGIEVVKSPPPTSESEMVVQGLNRSGPVSGGVLASPSPVCPILDPAIDAAAHLSLASPPLVTEIHAGLTRIVDDPVSPFELELAESYNLSADGLEYEFVLRNDLKLSDGSPLTSGDFKWSWERALKKLDAGTRARDVFGSVEGADAVILGESEDLTGVAVIDDRTFRVRLTNPGADFPALLADPVASVLKKDNVLTWGIQWTNSGSSTMTIPFNERNMRVGAGPFKLVEYEAHSQSDVAPSPGTRTTGVNRPIWMVFGSEPTLRNNTGRMTAGIKLPSIQWRLLRKRRTLSRCRRLSSPRNLRMASNLTRSFKAEMGSRSMAPWMLSRICRRRLSSQC